MRVQDGAYGVFVQVSAGELKAYPRSQAFLKNLATGGSYVHPWLTAVEAPVASPASPASLPAPTQVSSIQRALAPLRWADSKHLELDTLYAELAQIFVEHRSAVLHAAESSGELREAAVASYLKICESRKSSSNGIEPILSLHIHEAPENHVELVIYRNHLEHIQLFPKLQRTLAQSRLNLREV